MPTSATRDTPSASGIVATGTILALLYVGRAVLVPITLALILSLVIAPLVRLLRKIGLGQTLSVLAAVAAVGLCFAAAATAVGMQMARMTANLPQYEQTLRGKFAAFDAMTIGRLTLLSAPAQRLVDAPRTGAAAAAPAAAAPIAVQVYSPPPSSLQVLQKVLGSVWAPLETAGIVLVVLVFVLLEHEAVRDRFIRIAGGTDIRATTLALNDAGDRLSRFFVSQFAVNFAVGGVLSVGLTLIGLPHALLWGALAGVLRFVPYVGVWIAALMAGSLAAAVDPGWTPALLTLSLFVAVELVAGQLIEPQLFGHATGLSPLSVVIAAIFWSWLWGPVGLIVSTPLTLCLVVAGRHIKALSLLDVLLGDSQALTMPQRFYQRSLAGDAAEILVGARAYLKRNSLAAYCDVVLMPALTLARLDVDTGAITADQLATVREVMVAVVGALGAEGRRIRRRAMPSTVLDQSNVGRRLRTQRELAAGPYQGPLEVPPGSVMLCVGLGSTPDDLVTELLVRSLRDQRLDARHLSIADLGQTPPPNASAASVAVVFVVSAFPGKDRDRGPEVVAQVRQRFSGARIVTLMFPGFLLQPGPATDTIPTADRAATSFGQAVQICIDLHERAHRDDTPAKAV